MTPKKADQTPKPPKGLGRLGKRHWTDILQDYRLEIASQFRLLEHASRMLDVAEQARGEVVKHGLLTPDRFGVLKENPAAAVERQAMNAYRLAMRELGLDLTDGPAEVRGPGRTGTRS